MTAKARHRAELMRRAGRKPRCALAHRGGCRGELQADHVVELGWLKETLGRRRYRGEPTPCRRCSGIGVVVPVAGGATCPECKGTGEATWDAIEADADNGWLLCERHHGLKTAGLLLPPITVEELPDELCAFLVDYRCGHLLRNRTAFAVA